MELQNLQHPSLLHYLMVHGALFAKSNGAVKQ
jgi:hypothetical protein